VVDLNFVGEMFSSSSSSECSGNFPWDYGYQYDMWYNVTQVFPIFNRQLRFSGTGAVQQTIFF
jgi:hypothetical protein